MNARDGAGETPLVIASRVELGMSVRRTVPGLLVPMPWRGISSGSTAAVGEAPGVTRETIRNKEPALVALLLDAGADPNARDPDGLMALMYAAGQGRTELVRLLLARGADAEAKNAEGDTASTLAIGEEVMRALREARGNP